MLSRPIQAKEVNNMNPIMTKATWCDPPSNPEAVPFFGGGLDYLSII
jgi:hypothetical protein